MMRRQLVLPSRLGEAGRFRRSMHHRSSFFSTVSGRRDLLALRICPRVSMHTWHIVFLPKLRGLSPRPTDLARRRCSAGDEAWSNKRWT